MNTMPEIDDDDKQPIFKSVFGNSWDSLPVVIRKHYANLPYSNDLVTVEGTLDVTCGRVFRIFRPLLHLLGGIPPYTGRNVPVTVNFRSTGDTREFHFDRTFSFEGKKPWRFYSRMVQIEGNEVIEIMRFGIVWRMNYLWENNKVVLRHKGYGIRIFGRLIPLPFTVLLGEGNAEEIAVDENTFKMHVDISHPWWGKIYEYKGQFRITREA